MKRVAIVGDIHGNLPTCRRILQHIEDNPVDLILLVGDTSMHVPYRDRMDTELLGKSCVAVADLMSTSGIPVRWVPGNHDPREVQDARNVDGRLDAVAGLRVFGIGGAPGRFGFPYEWEEDEVEAIEVPVCDILLCHSPPYGGRLDRVARGGKHVGSTALLHKAIAHTGLYCCGHIHESRGAERKGDSLWVNAGALGQPYKWAGYAVATLDEGRWSAKFIDLDFI